MTTGNLTHVPNLLQTPPIQETILVVEDNKILRDSLSDLLELEGYQVISANNGRRALEVMELTTPDLVLSDIAMPEMDGITFFHTVRTQAGWQNIPFIFISAYSVKFEVAAAQEIVGEVFLIKPVDFDQLLGLIRDRLNGTAA
jgi:CheY-like chemotaxis protein